MITRMIDTEICVEDMEQAQALDAALTEAGADSSVARQRGKWTVFARYAPRDAVHVGRAIAEFPVSAELEGEA